MINTGPHLTDADIAGYLDSTLDEIRTARVRAHINVCQECRTLFLDASRMLAAWDADSSVFEPSSDQVETAMAVHAQYKGARGSGATRDSRRRQRGFIFRKLAVAAAIVVIAVGAWFGVLDRESGSTLDEHYLTSVRAAVETASNNTPIVIPGGAWNLSPAPSTHRGIQASNSLEESLEYFYHVFSQDKINRDAAFWLVAGCLATGQIGEARVYAGEAQALFPADTEIIMLAGLVAYTDSRYPEAEILLRKALEIDPTDPIAQIDLSLILIEQKKLEETITLLEGVKERHPDTPLARRAEQILTDLVPN